jgi:LAS superfamily LD-carboxypeptidase LdcB
VRRIARGLPRGDRSGERARGVAVAVKVALRTAVLVAGLAACSGGSSDSREAARTTSTTTSTTTTSTTTTTTTTTTTLPPGPPPYTAAIETVTAAELGASWHEGCPVAPENLRRVTVTFIDFEGGTQRGQVVVHESEAEDIVEVFRQLHAARFPIRKMKPIFTQAEYEDFETLDDNSTGFSCRNAVNANAAPHWSNHAYGYAIDINPIENPYLNGGRVLPSAGAAYTDRSNVRPGMAVSGSVIVAAFRSVGWGWGASFQDYQHFSTNGR